MLYCFLYPARRKSKVQPEWDVCCRALIFYYNINWCHKGHHLHSGPGSSNWMSSPVFQSMIYNPDHTWWAKGNRSIQYEKLEKQSPCFPSPLWCDLLRLHGSLTRVAIWCDVAVLILIPSRTCTFFLSSQSPAYSLIDGKGNTTQRKCQGWPLPHRGPPFTSPSKPSAVGCIIRPVIQHVSLWRLHS